MTHLSIYLTNGNNANKLNGLGDRSSSVDLIKEASPQPKTAFLYSSE
ncbi:hypothetical protein H6G81_29095 [Scytonema hofmannii FACHB-248]|uniref:Uncharacterized protein n=1 Tax=Scytonema hofmannii FACHB-248 TaxID=1842502 RepID=A0ABR8GZ35_9CYAN|nr:MULTISPECIES: hypothetical protein [Nostocales]MBD2608467.1 hypothetical protein [Scytonema hofmannii FACHB-248]